MKNLTIFFVLLCVFFFSGCVMFSPHFRTISYPIYGNVVAEDSNSPIENAIVKAYYSDNGRRKTKTDESGYFSFPEKKQLILFISGPNDEFLYRPDVIMKVKAKGFSERKISIPGTIRIFPDSNISYDEYVITNEGYIIIPLKEQLYQK